MRTLCARQPDDPHLLDPAGRTCEAYTGILLHGLGADGTGVPVGDVDHDFPDPHGPRFGQAAPRRPAVHAGAMQVLGRLAPEVVQRVLHGIRGRLRLCYANGLLDNPGLEGRVVARLTIGRDGAVAYASTDGASLPDARVVSCAMRGFEGLRFPPPEGGVVTVVYPIDFGDVRDAAP